MAPERTLQTKGRGDGVAKDSRKKLCFLRRWRFPDTGILINCQMPSSPYLGEGTPLCTPHAFMSSPHVLHTQVDWRLQFQGKIGGMEPPECLKHPRVALSLEPTKPQGSNHVGLVSFRLFEFLNSHLGSSVNW